MKAYRWYLRAACVWCAGFLAFDLWRHIWWGVAIQAVCLLVNGGLLIKEARNGRRKAAAHLGDSAGECAATGEGTGRACQAAAEGTRAGLEVIKTTDPVRAKKLARVELSHPSPRFVGIGRGGTYGVDDHASCLSREKHGAPSLNCGCGFYAMKDPRDVVPYGEYVVLDVELLGFVIECENGYRAERQRVLRVEVPRRCAFCAQAATGIGWYDDPERSGYGISFSHRYPQPHLVPICDRGHPSHGSLARAGFVFPNDPPQVMDPEAVHRVVQYVGGSLADLANRLGTEVVWA